MELTWQGNLLPNSMAHCQKKPIYPYFCLVRQLTGFTAAILKKNRQILDLHRDILKSCEDCFEDCA